MKTKRSEAEIIEDIQVIYGHLSPENLSCDGEAPRDWVEERYRELQAKLKRLFVELGREVSETEAFKLEQF